MVFYHGRLSGTAECPFQLMAVGITCEQEGHDTCLHYQHRRDGDLATIRGDQDGWTSEVNAGVMRQSWAATREVWNKDETRWPVSVGGWDVVVPSDVKDIALTLYRPRHRLHSTQVLDVRVLYRLLVGLAVKRCV